MKHSLYSPNLLPCDFFAFGYHKVKLKATVFSDEEELSVAISDIMTAIAWDLLLCVFSQ
jgi:hypothetical protein